MIAMVCLAFGGSVLAADNIVNVSHRIDIAHKAFALIEAAKSSLSPADLAKARAFFEDLPPAAKSGFFCELYKVSGNKADASAAFQAIKACDDPGQRYLPFAALWQATGNARCLELARENAAQLENLSEPPKGKTSFAPCQRSYAFLNIYSITKDPSDLAKARENAPDFFFLSLYKVTNDPADLARINGNIGDRQPTYKNIWWLMELYKAHRDPQQLAKAREFAKNHGPNNKDYSLPFLEIYKVTKDPQDLASARESNGDAQFLIMIYEVSQDYADLAAAREVAAKAPNSGEAICGFTQIWLRTHQSQDLESARRSVKNVSHYLLIYRIAKEHQDLVAARKFIGNIDDSFEKVRGFLEIYRATKDPQDLASAKKSIATVEDKAKRAVAAEMVKRATQQAQAPNKEVREKYASS
jgi:hypothetical protein